MQGHSPVLVVEHGHQLQPGAEGLEVLAERRDAYVVGVLKLETAPWVTSSGPANSAWLMPRRGATRTGGSPPMSRLAFSRGDPWRRDAPRALGGARRTYVEPSDQPLVAQLVEISVVEVIGGGYRPLVPCVPVAALVASSSRITCRRGRRRTAREAPRPSRPQFLHVVVPRCADSSQRAGQPRVGPLSGEQVDTVGDRLLLVDRQRHPPLDELVRDLDCPPENRTLLIAHTLLRLARRPVMPRRMGRSD